MPAGVRSANSEIFCKIFCSSTLAVPLQSIYNDNGSFFADGVGNLQQTLVGNSGGNDILCQIAHHVSCRTVNLAGIFSRKSSAAVRRITAVGVGDNFASGKAAVTVGTADDKTSGRIDQQPNVIGKSVSGMLRRMIGKTSSRTSSRDKCSLCWVDKTTEPTLQTRF